MAVWCYGYQLINRGRDGARPSILIRESSNLHLYQHASSITSKSNALGPPRSTIVLVVQCWTLGKNKNNREYKSNESRFFCIA